MAFRDYDKVWALPLPPAQKLVLLALAKHANEEGFAWPSVDTLVRLTSSSESTVYRALSKLKESGLIEATRGDHLCLYQLHLD